MGTEQHIIQLWTYNNEIASNMTVISPADPLETRKPQLK